MMSVSKYDSHDFLINKVLPTIKAKCPAEEKGMPIYIQQDNAKTHIDVNDPAFVGTLGSHANRPILLTLMCWTSFFCSNLGIV
jgi:hypothetical protein